MSRSGEPLLELRLSVDYRGGSGVLQTFELTIAEGELIGLAGQSGSGKSTLALAILGLLDERRARIEGSIRFRQQELLGLGERQWRSIRGRRIALVFQSAVSSLTPTMRLGDQIREAWQAHSNHPAEWRMETASTLGAVGLPTDDSFLRLFPRELSVGMAQRFLAAMAVLHKPDLLIADEPTSALDVITQSELLKLFQSLNSQHGTAILFITHDIAVAASFCHRIAILHDGAIVESGAPATVLTNPREEYTKRLVSAVPQWNLG